MFKRIILLGCIVSMLGSVLCAQEATPQIKLRALKDVALNGQAVSSDDWVLSVLVPLDADSRLLDLSQLSARMNKDPLSQNKGWISLEDDAGISWQPLTLNYQDCLTLTANLTDNWESETGVKSGSDITVQKIGLHVLYSKPAFPEHVQLALYAGKHLIKAQRLPLTLFTPSHLSSSDVKPLISQISVDGLALGEAFESGDYVSDQPRIQALLEEPQEGVISWNIRFRQGEFTVLSQSESVATQSSSTIDFQPDQPLSPGVYSVDIQAENATNQLGTETLDIEVEGGLKIKQLLCGPLPWGADSATLSIDYQLSADANVEIRIYDIAGELQKKLDLMQGEEGGKRGFNQLSWNGINDYNESIRNGPYVLYLVAENETGKAMAKTKLLVLK